MARLSHQTRKGESKVDTTTKVIIASGLLGLMFIAFAML